MHYRHTLFTVNLLTPTGKKGCFRHKIIPFKHATLKTLLTRPVTLFGVSLLADSAVVFFVNDKETRLRVYSHNSGSVRLELSLKC